MHNQKQEQIISKPEQPFPEECVCWQLIPQVVILLLTLKRLPDLNGTTRMEQSSLQIRAGQDLPVTIRFVWDVGNTAVIRPIVSITDLIRPAKEKDWLWHFSEQILQRMQQSLPRKKE